MAAFDVLEGILENCNQNFRAMNCVTGYVPGRRRAARAIPPIAEAITVSRFAGDRELRQHAESAMLNIPWYYAVKHRPTAERLLEVLCAGLEADRDEARDGAAAALPVVLDEVSAWQPDLMKPTADRLLDMAVRQDSPSEPLMGSLLFCLVILPQDVELTRRVQAIETHIARLLDEGELPRSKPSEAGTAADYRYGHASKRYWAACALLKYGTSAAVPALSVALKDEDDNISGTALAALRRIGGPDARESLRKAAESGP
jgi:hypothetical protein